MHAHTEQLLTLRDGEPIDARVARHVAECPTCLRELDRLKQMQSALRAMPVRQVPPAAWRNIRASMQSPLARQFSTRRLLARMAAAVGFVAIAIMMALRFGSGGQHEAPFVEQRETHTPALVERPSLSAATVEQLVEQSRQLEDVLRNLPAPRVERVALAATTDIIEQRIQWLDFQLSFEPEAELSQEQTRRLWHERVDLMDSLVKVRYAQAQGLAF
jgi:anti-sigma factor RsiW